ncbi:MAG: family 43 glycosylhydrolase [Paludibacter sp.]|nr:family 43 glycosylhydrolase [Paludibacter sp.]
MKKNLLILPVFLLILLNFNVQAVNTLPLKSLISDCQKILSQSSEGVQNGDYRIGSQQELQTAVAYATSILNDTTSTQVLLTSEVDSLFTAYSYFTKQRYGIAPPNWSDNYWQLASNSALWGPYNLHDPSVIKTDGYYYVFSTDAAWANTSAGIPVRRSRDMVNWEFRGWAFNGFPTEPSDWFKLQQPAAEAKKAVNGLWAPYIMKVGTQYRLYYSAVFEGGGALIGLATSNNIEGPWTQIGKVISTYDIVNVNAIDPTVSVDKNGRYWMIYGSWSNGIYSFELDPVSGLKKDTTTPVLIARNGPNNTWSWKSCLEGPEIIYNSKFGKYYLFVAQGSLGNIYQTRVARSDNPNGPYYDYFGVNVAYSAASPKYPEIYPLLTYAYQFRNHPGWQGVSHVGVFSDGKDFFMMHQGRPSANASMMVMHNRKISWTADGWPTVSPERYANAGIMPVITSDSIVGNWEEIQLNELKDASGSFAGRVTPVVDDTVSAWKYLNVSKTAIYKSDGSYIYGTEVGKWKLSGDTIITTRSTRTFKGIVSYEYDWENNQPTLVYTGLRYDGHSIWGKKIHTRISNNIILNPAFDDGLTNWVIDKNGGSFNEEVVTTGITGNSFHALCIIRAPNYYSRQIRWLFPVPKCGRYKITFKAKLLTADTLNFEIQDNSSGIPILRTSFKAGAIAGTYSFITQDIPVTSTLYTMNIAYGSLNAGNELWLDDFTVDEVTDHSNDNYITNGNFTDVLNGWTTFKATRFIGKMGVDSINKIDAHPSIQLKVNLASTIMTDAQLKWITNLHSGSKYVLEFMAKSTTGFNLQARLISGASAAYTSSVTSILGDWTTYRFVFPEVTTAGIYTTEIDYGKAVTGSEIWLSNFSLKRCTGDCTNTAVEVPAVDHELKIYPNPATNYFELSSLQGVQQLSVYSIDGKMVKTYREITSTKIDISDLKMGSYIVKVQIGKTANIRLLLIKK